MPPQTNTEEIIEKKATAPVATSCLIIAAVALLCAIALQITEIAEYRSGLASASSNPGLDQAKKDAKKYQEEIGDILSKAPKTEGEAAAPKAGAGAAEPAAEDADAATDAGAADTKAEPADTKEAAEGTEEADTKADAEPADTKEAAPDTKADAKEAEETPADEAADEAADEKAGE